jgi:hypothetical protein
MITGEELKVGGTYWLDFGDGKGEVPIWVWEMSEDVMIGIYIVYPDGSEVKATVNRDYLQEYGSVRTVIPATTPSSFGGIFAAVVAAVVIYYLLTR